MPRPREGFWSRARRLYKADRADLRGMAERLRLIANDAETGKPLGPVHVSELRQQAVLLDALARPEPQL